jgi:hypothetical protein
MVEKVKEIKEIKKETAADIIAREKAKHKHEEYKKCHLICSRCRALHYGKITDKGMESINNKDTMLATGQKLKYKDVELLEMLCLKCGSSFWVVNPLGKQDNELKNMSVIWD